MPPIQRATFRRPARGEGEVFPSTSFAVAKRSRLFRVVFVLALALLLAYYFANTLLGAVRQVSSPGLRQIPVIPPSLPVQKTALQLQEEAGAREAKLEEEEEAEEQEEEEVSPPDAPEEDELEDGDEELESLGVIQHSGDEHAKEEQLAITTAAAAKPSVVKEEEGEEEAAGDVTVVDPNATDVQVDEEEGDDDEDLPTDNHQGPQRLPKYSMEFLESKGFGPVLFAYRVVASHVTIRTQPSPIGSLAQTNPKAVMGLMKGSHKHGDVVVGYQLSKQFGLWLKLAPHTWIPILKKDTPEGSFHSLLKQIRKISLPRNLARHWKKQRTDCTKLTVKRAIEVCEEKNLIHDGVLQLMRRTKLMSSEMDPDLHPFTVTVEDVEEDVEDVGQD
ncbi:hypothetical protein BASA81_001056 [Batrachochytrium salamandrivorans]|nr:hypothetical protein BASA81_001056 [Batrachochytrium salamandrivorans]